MDNLSESYTYFKVKNLNIYAMEKYSFDSTLMAKDPNSLSEADFKRSNKMLTGYFIYDSQRPFKMGFIEQSNQIHRASVDSFFEWNGTNSRSEEAAFNEMTLVSEERLSNGDVLKKYVKKEDKDLGQLKDSTFIFYNADYNDLNYSVIDGSYSLPLKTAYKKINIGYFLNNNGQKDKDSFYTITVEVKKQTVTKQERETISKIFRKYKALF